MSLKAKIETVLFITARAMTIEEISKILNTDPVEVESVMLDLIMDYASRESALEIDDEDGYIIQVRQEHMDIVEKLVPVELKSSVLKTLSIIALKGPLKQSLLIQLRGQAAYYHIQELLEKGLITRKREKEGRSYIIRTTNKFSEYFKLKGDTKALAKVLDIEINNAEKLRKRSEEEQKASEVHPPEENI